MTTTYHMSLNLKAAIRNGWLDIFTNDAGEPISEAEAKDQIQTRIDAGQEVLTLAECDNHDPITGHCLGHANR